MIRNQSHEQQISRVARELGTALRRQAKGKWTAVRTAGRSEDRRHAWRFAHADSSQGTRFLRVTHKAMMQSAAPVPMLLEQLNAGRWLDRLNEGPETSLVLRSGGRLESTRRN